MVRFIQRCTKSVRMMPWNSEVNFFLAERDTVRSMVSNLPLERQSLPRKVLFMSK